MIGMEATVRHPPSQMFYFPSERIRTASEILIEVDLTNQDAVPTYVKISVKV